MGVLIKLIVFVFALGLFGIAAAMFGIAMFIHGVWSKLKGPFKEGFYGRPVTHKVPDVVDYRDDIKQFSDTLKEKGYLKRRKAPVTLIEDETIRDMLLTLSSLIEDPEAVLKDMGLKLCWESDFIIAPSNRVVIVTPSKYGILI